MATRLPVMSMSMIAQRLILGLGKIGQRQYLEPVSRTKAGATGDGCSSRSWIGGNGCRRSAHAGNGRCQARVRT
jgi:hypothetical protein